MIGRLKGGIKETRSLLRRLVSKLLCVNYLCESENVVNEEQDILSLLITEIFSHSQSSESNTSSGAGGFVHLTVDKSDLGGFILQTDDTSLNHLMIQIIALTGSFSDSGKDGVTTMSLGDVVDQFHDQDGLADSGSAEETNLTSLGVGSEQIYDLDTSDENLLFDAHVLELWSLSMDSLSLVSGNGTPLINGFTNDVDDPAKSLRSHGDHDGIASVVDNLASNQTLCTIHGNGSDGVLSQVLGNLQDELGLTVLNLQGVEDLWESIFKLDVNNGSNNGDNLALGKSSGGCGGAYRQISSL